MPRLLFALICLLQCCCFFFCTPLGARIVRTRQGLVKGVLVVPSNRDLQPVEAFLGIPYASPPVGALRFMPPVSPLPWQGVRLMDKYGPVCPQTLPDVGNEKEALRFVTKGRLQYLRRLLPYLRNQSEDCLYLNIYAPVTGSKDSNIKFPVIVFIHGESFEWNSGNPYDGSILSSYGDVVVVTFNFRLGVLGFLRPGLRENTVSNFGLLDQIAALQWIKDNIAEFGGDAESVTLLGHGTGAACVNLLLISPVAQASSGLFHRAIMMSGTALADWAIADNPLRYTLQAAQQADCTLAERNDEMAMCLRFKKVTDLMSIRLQAPLYASPLAPVIDGIVVPNDPRQLMETYNDLFGRYDIMVGITQSESFHLLNANTVDSGLTETERNRVVRTYVRNNFGHNIDQITAAILNEYTDWKNPARDTLDFRDSILDILSDARVVAPVTHTADLHSAIHPRSYFYVFAHQSTYGDFPQNWGSIHGDEVAYVLGMPLVGGTNHFTMNYTRAEMLLSEMVMTYWTNFARTGNPNFPPRQKFLSVSPKDRFEPSYVQWPAYDRQSQKYLSIELRPKVKDHYRADKMALWLKLIPELIINDTGDKVPTDEEDLVVNNAGFRPVLPVPRPTTSDPVKTETEEDAHISISQLPSPTNVSSTTTPESVHSGSLALSIVIVVGICFLVLNMCACAGVFYQRDRVRFKERLLQRQYKLRPAREATKAQKRKSSSVPNSGGANAFEEDGGEDQKSLPNQPSTSTMDPHTKVREWIAHEIIERCTPRSNRKQHTGKIPEGGSDRYDPRDSVDPSALFPLLKKSEKEPNIPTLVPEVPEHKEAVTTPTGGLDKKEGSEVQLRAPSGTSRRKARTKSQTSLNRSVIKRDVAVGDDEDVFSPLATSREEEEITPRDAMATIRRLNLPKVLPDLPQQEPCGKIQDPVYAVPVKKSKKQTSPETEKLSTGPMVIRTNIPQTLVVAPHPRATHSGAPAKIPPANATSIPEPELRIRPGEAAGGGGVVRRPPQQHPPTGPPPRPRSQTGRSWYAQYSQSFISQSIDQESDSQDT